MGRRAEELQRVDSSRAMPSGKSIRLDNILRGTDSKASDLEASSNGIGDQVFKVEWTPHLKLPHFLMTMELTMMALIRKWW